MAETVSLKPCPFCGEAMEQHASYSNDWQLHARRRGARCPAATVFVRMTDPESVAAWNRRATDPAVAELVEALKAGWLGQAAKDAIEVVRLETDIERLQEIVSGFLDCPEIADCAPEDKDTDTDDLERRARALLAKHAAVACQASWRDGECMLADKDCPNPTKGDPSNCPRKQPDPAVAELVEALEWYGENARLCRLIHSEGDAGRHALSADGGKRAHALIAKHAAKP